MCPRAVSLGGQVYCPARPLALSVTERGPGSPTTTVTVPPLVLPGFGLCFEAPSSSVHTFGPDVRLRRAVYVHLGQT